MHFTLMEPRIDRQPDLELVRDLANDHGRRCGVPQLFQAHLHWQRQRRLAYRRQRYGDVNVAHGELGLIDRQSVSQRARHQRV